MPAIKELQQQRENQISNPPINKVENSDNQSVIIIGSGLGGLSTAIRLAIQGEKVTIFEANHYVGGKMEEWSNAGYRFDLGPSVFTMPQYLEELFQLAGKKISDYLEIEQPELPFNYFFEDGLTINCYADVEKLVKEIANKTEDDEATIWRYLEDISTKFDLTETVFLKNSLHILSNYLTKAALRGMINFPKVEVFRSLNKANEKSLKDERNVRLFNTFASYLGSNPYRAPGVLKVISHFQLNLGVYLPKGGIAAIANALKRLAQELGVRIYCNSPVEEIVLKNKKAIGVRVNKQEYLSKIVISNLDVCQTYPKLLPTITPPTRFLNHEKSHSAVVFLWGVDRQFPELALHNMMVSEDMKGEYKALFDRGEFGKDISVYIYISNKTNREDAPKGCENWYILVNAPNDQGQNWEELISEVRRKVLKKLKVILKTDLRPHIKFEKVQDPRTFAQKTGTIYGAIYGNSFNGTFSVFRRHPNFTSKVKNLYFCGGTVHPGAGVPLTLLSAKIVAKLISKKEELS